MLTKSLFDGKDGFVNKKKKNENVRKCEDAAEIVGEKEKSIEKREKKHCKNREEKGHLLHRFKELNGFVDMIKQVRIRKSTVKFKINLFRLSIKNPSIENLMLLLLYIIFYFKQVNLTCKTIK